MLHTGSCGDGRLHNVTGYAQRTHCSLFSNYDILIIGFNAGSYCRTVHLKKIVRHAARALLCVCLNCPQHQAHKGGQHASLHCQRHATSGHLHVSKTTTSSWQVRLSTVATSTAGSNSTPGKKKLILALLATARLPANGRCSLQCTSARHHCASSAAHKSTHATCNLNNTHQQDSVWGRERPADQALQLLGHATDCRTLSVGYSMNMPW